MFTNNFLLFQKVCSLGTNDGSSYFYMKTAGGLNYDSYIPYQQKNQGLGYNIRLGRCRDFNFSTNDTSASNGGVYFGSGTTPATKDDYALEAPITSGLTITSQAKTNLTDKGNGTFVMSASHILQNTSGGAITVSEVGLFIPVANSSAYYIPVLMERTVLDEPITIPAGEAKMVTYQITFNQSQ